MKLRGRIFFIPSLILIIALSQFGCDRLSDFLENFSGQHKKEEGQPPKPSDEKTQLMNILENQQELIEQIKNAQTYGGDKRSIKESYEAVLRLDQNYQQEYARDEGRLSASDCTEISNKHYAIMKSLPQYSNIME
jgi:cell division protein FtsB